MQTTTSYKPKHPHKVSPGIHKQLQDKALDFQNPRHPVNQEIQKNIGNFNFSAEIRQDTSTLNRFKHIPGLVAFIAILKRDGTTVGEGRGAATVNQANRYIEKVIRYASNSALIDGFVKSVKALGTLQVETTKPKDVSIPIEDFYSGDKKTTEMISKPQKKYLLELVHQNITDEEKRCQWESNLEDFTKAEASKAIQDFKS